MSSQPQTFHPFLRLPKELQIHILNYASAPTQGSHVAINKFGIPLLRYFYRLFMNTTFDYEPGLHVSTTCFDYGFSNGNRLLTTSWLCRQIALEAWKKEILCLDYEKPMCVGRSGANEGRMIYMTEWKAMLLRRVDMLLANVPGRRGTEKRDTISR